MEYKIVRGASSPELETIVNKYLKEGWEICGSLSVNASLTYWVQPMILKTKTKE